MVAAANYIQTQFGTNKNPVLHAKTSICVFLKSFILYTLIYTIRLRQSRKKRAAGSIRSSIYTRLFELGTAGFCLFVHLRDGLCYVLIKRRPKVSCYYYYCYYYIYNIYNILLCLRTWVCAALQTNFGESVKGGNTARSGGDQVTRAYGKSVYVCVYTHIPSMTTSH